MLPQSRSHTLKSLQSSPSLPQAWRGIREYGGQSKPWLDKASTRDFWALVAVETQHSGAEAARRFSRQGCGWYCMLENGRVRRKAGLKNTM